MREDMSMEFNGSMDQMAGKLVDLDTRVRIEMRKATYRETLDRMVLDGELGYDSETDEYWRLPVPADEPSEPR